MNLTFEWLLSYKNTKNMTIQAIDFRKAMVTNGTLKWFLSLMNTIEETP